MGAIGEKHDLEFAFEELFEENGNQLAPTDLEEPIKITTKTVPLNKVGLHDFKILKLVGKGGFGKVNLSLFSAQ
jgi:hypothetical protein